MDLVAHAIEGALVIAGLAGAFLGGMRRERASSARSLPVLPSCEPIADLAAEVAQLKEQVRELAADVAELQAWRVRVTGATAEAMRGTRP